MAKHAWFVTFTEIAEFHTRRDYPATLVSDKVDAAIKSALVSAI